MNELNEPSAPVAPPTLPIVTDEMLLNCMQCGFCLPHCPTYSLTGLERYSPRGRIQLTRAIHEGTFSSTEHADQLSDSIDTCLGCLACQTACPAGVEYEKIFESAKTVVQAHYAKHPTLASWLLRLAMRHVFPYPKRFKLLSRLIWLSQKLPLGAVLPKPLKRMLELSPRISNRFFDEDFKGDARRSDEPTALLLSGCVMNTAFSDVHHDTAAVLKRAGFHVDVPNGQGCCGALHAHNGFLDEARELARKNIDVFSAQSGAIVINSAGCGAMMKHYATLFEPTDIYHQKAVALSMRVQDLSETLVAQGVSGSTPFDKISGLRVTYQDACHLEHGQKIRNEPRALLKQKFSDVVELGSPMCCGSAGIYNLMQPERSEELLAEKIKAIERTGADIVVTANPGCLLQLRYGVAKAGLKVRVMHFATALNYTD